MSETREYIVIFDDFVRNDGKSIYRDCAEKVVTEMGFIPQVFSDARKADRYLFETEENIAAIITALGSRAITGFGREFPASPILSQSRFLGLPVALLSGNPNASRFLRDDSRDILIPKYPLEEIEPKLHKWLTSLITA